MPYIHVSLAGRDLSPEAIEQLGNDITGLMVEVMRKKRDLTAVRIEQVATQGWTIGAAPVRIAAHLEANVTDGTNSPEEKARFVAEAMAALKRAMGPDLPVATYVIVRDVSGNAWGYDGRTQDARKLAA